MYGSELDTEKFDGFELSGRLEARSLLMLGLRAVTKGLISYPIFIREDEEWCSCVGKDIASEERSERSYAKPIVRDKPCASSQLIREDEPESKNYFEALTVL